MKPMNMRRPFTPDTSAYTYVDTPMGKMLLVGKTDTLMGAYLESQRLFHTIKLPEHATKDLPCFKKMARQLQEYFRGERTQLTVNYTLAGSTLQQKTWEQLRHIPYGTQISYTTLASATTYGHAVRAVASAVGNNPLLILIPCHRVIKQDGRLGGFAAGLSIKQQLLDLERASYACGG